jgi:multidrug efflux pump subunit AcrA (membrane-fusion protein)
MTTAAPPSADRSQVSPDQLDRLLVLIRPRIWIVLAALLVLVGLAVAWGFLGTVRETVSAKGIVQRGEGLNVVQAPEAGRVSAVEAAVDDRVAKGDPLARMVGSDGGDLVLRAPIDGRVIDTVADGAAVVEMGARLFALEPTRGQMATSLAVPVDRRSELYVGAQVQVRPDSVDESEVGYVHGEISSISPYPASDDELDRVFGSQRVVDEVAGSPAVYVVRAKLLTDRSGGLEWSTPTGSETPIRAGELTDASIVVSEGSIVDQVFP